MNIELVQTKDCKKIVNKLSKDAEIFVPQSKLDTNKESKDQGGMMVNGTCNNNQMEESSHTLLQMQILQVTSQRGQSKSACALWDAGSTLCFITFNLAKELQLQGEPITLDITTVGGDCKKVNSQKYIICIEDKSGSLIKMEVFGIDKISTEIHKIDISHLIKEFKSPQASQLSRPLEGSIDLLIGYQYAAYHPVPVESVDHLLLMENRFGVILAGSHPDCAEMTRQIVKHATVLHTVNAEDFYNIESLGVSCTPACGSCKCGHCHPGGKNMTLHEEKELKWSSI